MDSLIFEILEVKKLYELYPTMSSLWKRTLIKIILNMQYCSTTFMFILSFSETVMLVTYKFYLAEDLKFLLNTHNFMLAD